MSDHKHRESILILDFGAQYTQLIARRVRESGVYSEILPFDVSGDVISDFAPSGVILSGGPESTTAGMTPRIPQEIFDLGVPILGICYGMQALTIQLGGEVESAVLQEFGHAEISACTDVSNSFLKSAFDQAGIEGQLDVWMSHGDKVTRLPDGFECVASSSNAPYAALQDRARRIFAVQFHPEVTHTSGGTELIRHFVRQECGCSGDWTPESIIDEAIVQIREQVGSDKVILGLSGGVDSSVVAGLLSRAIGDQLTCVFVDNGLLRQGEREEVQHAFGNKADNALALNLITVDAESEFLGKLAGVEEPEVKRKIIGETFIDVFDAQAKKLKNVVWLAQGTIYPDVIESAASKYGKAHVIKSHHNVGGLPERMKLKLVEPLRELFKDEVRKVGLALGLPESLINRHPFPGPGLAVRILGEVKKPVADILRLADAIFMEELRNADYYRKVDQAFAVFLPVHSVGVVGDARRYEPVIALRAVETTDFMTANWAHLPYDLIGKVSNRIINEISGISRVVYDVSNKPPATIEWE
ncbi:MAG: glutamine-hydrolyzing GMP synthase [Pseudomonadales bacterium]|nr:glutamine-hydrolyzing GMP synthase [Pseudomonadales bacterium]